MLVLTQSCPSLAIHTMGWQCHCVTPTPWVVSVIVSHQHHRLSVLVSHQHHGLSELLFHTITMGCQCPFHTNTMGWQCHSVTPTPWAVNVICSHQDQLPQRFIDQNRRDWCHCRRGFRIDIHICQPGILSVCSIKSLLFLHSPLNASATNETNEGLYTITFSHLR